MRLLPSDPDVATIVNRITIGDIDLQPDFQRGEVWSKPKKQRLIDSILREWHVPPIHVIENPNTRKQEVLDGQQRLASIRDFVHGHFPIDGTIEPIENALRELDGRYYDDLPAEWRRRFNQFTIRLFRIVDYNAAEPAELFFRLNQPSSLTGAEQRNAFFGPVREQIKYLVGELEARLRSRSLGFSNSRMAYDDVLSRTALALQRGTLSEKITAADLASLYRAEQKLNSAIVNRISSALSLLTSALSFGDGQSFKFNKATLFSWLIFLLRASRGEFRPIVPGELAQFARFFAIARNRALYDPDVGGLMKSIAVPESYIIAVYENRSAARVADVSSVILRDAVLWAMFEEFNLISGSSKRYSLLGLDRIRTAFGSDRRFEDDIIARKLIELGWGRLS